MKRSTSVVTIAILVVGGFSAARAEEPAPIPDSCPVTRPTEPRYDPDLPYGRERNADSFWYGSDALFVWIRADGRWHAGSKTDGRWHTDSKKDSFLFLWFRKQRDWQADFPRPQLNVTAQRIDADEPQAIIPLVQSESPGEHAAVLPTLIKLQKRGCWQISANYKADYLSFVVWVD